MGFTGQFTEAQTQLVIGGMFHSFIYMQLIIVIIAILKVVGMRKTFEKAGKPGRASLIPIYNIYIILKIIGKSGSNLRWIFFPPVFIILLIIWMFKLPKKYGLPGIFGLGLIFLSPIFWLILGLGKYKYIGNNENNLKENNDL